MSKTTPRTESSSPPGHQDQSARLAASAPVDQVGGTSLDLKKLRRYHFVIFLAFAFGFPLLVSAVFVFLSHLVTFIESHFSEYQGAIYCWLLWLCLCLFVAIKVYLDEKQEQGL